MSEWQETFGISMAEIEKKPLYHVCCYNGMKREVQAVRAEQPGEAIGTINRVMPWLHWAYVYLDEEKAKEWAAGKHLTSSRPQLR